MARRDHLNLDLFNAELTPMATFEFGWVGLILARNIFLITLLFGGLHLYFYVYKGQGDAHRFTTRPFATDSRRFLLKIKFGTTWLGH